MPRVRFGRRPAASRLALTAMAFALLLVAACRNDRPTEPGTGIESELTTTTVDCANGCKDTFTDADGTPLAAHSPDAGGFTWDLVENFGFYDAVIRNNAVTVDGADTLDNQFSYRIPEVFVDDTVGIEFEVFGNRMPLGGFYTVFITLRGNGTHESGYAVYVAVEGDSTTVGFTRNAVRIPADAPGHGVPRLGRGVRRLLAVSSGGTLKAFLDGVLVNSVTDPAPLPPGNPGFGLLVAVADGPEGSQLRVTTFEVRPVYCPPTGLPVLDDPGIQHSLNKQFESSVAEVKEHGGYVLEDPATGALSMVELPPGYGHNACNVTFPSNPSYPGFNIVGTWHTHVLKPGTLLRPLCPNRTAKERAGNGPSIEYDIPLANGTGLNAYIIDENEAFVVLPPGANWARFPWTETNGCRTV